MASKTKTVSVSLINHHPHWDGGGTVYPDCMKLPRYDVGCRLYYVGQEPETFQVRDQVQFAEDFTADFQLPEGQVRGAEFFWKEKVGTCELGRLAWYDLPQADQGKPWGWVGMFWLFDTSYERTACGIALTKFDPSNGFPQIR